MKCGAAQGRLLAAEQFGELVAANRLAEVRQGDRAMLGKYWILPCKLRQDIDSRSAPKVGKGLGAGKANVGMVAFQPRFQDRDAVAPERLEAHRGPQRVVRVEQHPLRTLAITRHARIGVVQWRQARDEPE